MLVGNYCLHRNREAPYGQARAANGNGILHRNLFFPKELIFFVGNCCLKFSRDFLHSDFHIAHLLVH
jgi:hypothetical protein